MQYTKERTSSDFNESQNEILQLQNSLLKLELDNAKLRKEWADTAQELNQLVKRANSEYQQTLNQYEKINQERLEVIQKFKMALLAYKLAMPHELIKSLFRPRITKLHQYKPKEMKLPKYYNEVCHFDKPYPIISIVTPSFNQANFLEKTMISVIEQKYPGLEYIVQDGGSTDDSIDIIKRYAFRLKYWESKKDLGQANAMNLGFKHAHGEIMAYLNSDDILLPGTVPYVVDYFNKHPNVDVIYGHRIVIDEEDQEIGRWILPPHDSNMLMWADYVPQETLFWRRRIWEKVGGFVDESFHFAMDWDLLLRFKEAGANMVRLPRFLGGFRFHSQQKTSACSKLGITEMQRLRLRCHGKEVTSCEIQLNLRPYMLKHILLHRLYQLGILRY